MAWPQWVGVLAGVASLVSQRNSSGDASLDSQLRTLKVQQVKERLSWGKAWADAEGLLFTWEDVVPLLPDYVSKAFIASQAGAGLPRLKLHARSVWGA